MSQDAIATGYLEAAKIVSRSRMECADLKPLWEKLQRIGKYIDQQAAAELAETLS